MKKQGIGSHQSAKMVNDEWITPRFITDMLDPFDLDPCSAVNMPWVIAKNTYNINDNGLIQPWVGRVWCNPPYGKETGKWLNKLAEHKNGIALIFARTETKMFFDHVWDKADAVLFIEGRLYFHYVDGTRAKANSGAPSVLVAYGRKNAKILRRSGIRGKFIKLKR